MVPFSIIFVGEFCVTIYNIYYFCEKIMYDEKVEICISGFHCDC